jgi:hypothetical protein
MQDELSAILGRTVDLNTPGFLSKYFRDEVIAGALPIYESDRIGRSPADPELPLRLVLPLTSLGAKRWKG